MHKLNISQSGKYRDRLNVTFLEKYMFRGMDTSVLITDVMIKPIRKQFMNPEIDSKTLAYIKQPIFFSMQLSLIL